MLPELKILLQKIKDPENVKISQSIRSLVVGQLLRRDGYGPKPGVGSEVMGLLVDLIKEESASDMSVQDVVPVLAGIKGKDVEDLFVEDEQEKLVEVLYKGLEGGVEGDVAEKMRRAIMRLGGDRVVTDLARRINSVLADKVIKPQGLLTLIQMVQHVLVTTISAADGSEEKKIALAEGLGKLLLTTLEKLKACHNKLDMEGEKVVALDSPLHG